ncbi:MAG: lipoprotein NlpI [Betaproteobacteria bacterium ADurb.Bin341]|nr:MAG: lipoprotein NlpI [Betaproteobacteria bacterium ADurb.Bin341]
MLKNSDPVLQQSFLAAQEYYQRGDLASAEAICSRLLAIDPADEELLLLFGNVQVGKGSIDVGLECLRMARQLKPENPDISFALGVALQKGGRFSEAVEVYRATLALKPNCQEYQVRLNALLAQTGENGLDGVAFPEPVIAQKTPSANSTQQRRNPSTQEKNKLADLFNQGRLNEAAALAQTMVDNFPSDGFAWMVLGLALGQMARYEDAVTALQKAVSLMPRNAEAHCNLASILQALGRPEECEASCRKALQIEPRMVEALNNLGGALHAQGKLDEALLVYQQALKIRPGMFEAHSNLGIVYYDLGRYEEAQASYQRALRIQPRFAEAHSNLGVVYQTLGQLEESEACCRKAAEIQPDYAKAYSNLANVLKEKGAFAEAESNYRRALQLKPDYAEAFDNLLFTINYHPDRSGEEIFAAYQQYDKRFGLPHHAKWYAHSNSRDTRRRLRVGYVSPDFRRHSCRHFLEPLLAYHDKNAVEVYAYAELAREDEVTARYRGYVDHWVRTLGMSHDALADRIRSDGIDILVDLAGHTEKNRLAVFARKPAPVSLSWLGYGYTTGLSAIDYFLTDSVSVPAGSEALFSERPWRIEHPALVYRPAENMGQVGALPANKRGYLTLGTLTRAVRINHRTIRVWSEILKRLDGTRLVVDSGSYKGAMMQDDLVRQFAEHGIDCDRLEIGCHSPPWDVLRGLDIGLDCFPHNSGTTLFETLYMGIPFVTLADRPSVGRLGSAILQAIGHPEWIARSEEEYIEITVSLASDLGRLMVLREGLRGEMENCALMDEPAFARKVEAAYRQMWVKWCEAEL